MGDTSEHAPGYSVDAGSRPESTWLRELAPWTGRAEDLLTHPRGFRDAAARLTAHLLSRHGAAALDRIEDAVQEAFVAAARSWPLRGTPASPMAWLTQVAQRRYLDLGRPLRRLVLDEATVQAAADPVSAAHQDDHIDAMLNDSLDESLRLLFMCCHPALSRESRIALTLKHVSQLSVEEIARLLRAEPTAVAQRLVRAKRTLRDVRATFAVPPAADLPARLDDVLLVCYALFTEGHLPTSGDAPLREDLCVEALRLVEHLRGWPPTALPVTHALASLCWLTMARFPARDQSGSAVPLARQDRSRWDPRCLRRGLAAFEMAVQGPHLSRYHLEAHIALLHGTSPSYDETPWEDIVSDYDRLLALAASPAAELARAIALAECGRMTQAQQALDTLETTIGDWPEWHATAGALALTAGNVPLAVSCYDAALAYPVAAPVRAYWIEQRASALDRLDPSTREQQSSAHPEAPTTRPTDI
ncbi:MAG: RNA polymerase subunit sigma-70 [Gemmatimonadaceae bacterium]|nr:RNA polymerase subunit sigma-70 [Gemmatimonadaceae bacterium]